jgi:hypothetical protein
MNETNQRIHQRTHEEPAATAVATFGPCATIAVTVTVANTGAVDSDEVSGLQL